MSNASPAKSTSSEELRKAPVGEFPPLQPPTAGFILQLFVIPMVIVTIIVVIWLLFNWLAHMGSNPTELVRDLKKMNESSWQSAVTLADMLRNPRYKELKTDTDLAQQVVLVLAEQIKGARMEDGPIQLRVYLCRLLGEFQVPIVLPTLLEAASVQRADAEVQVRRSAVQSLAVYINQNGPARARENDEIERVLLAASRERSESDPGNSLAELRSTAAFALGVLGSDRAIERLLVMLDDAYANARYNAAVAMCRNGDERALRVLLEMIDPDNDDALRYERSDEEKLQKRLMVMQNGIRAAVRLAEKNSAADLTQLADALGRVSQSPLSKFDAGTRRGIRIEADEARFRLAERRAG